MILLSLTTDKLSLKTLEAADIDIVTAFTDRVKSTGVVGLSDRQLTNITAAATTDITASPAADTTRNVEMIHGRNVHASAPSTVTLIYNANGTLYEVYQVTLYPGDSFLYVEGEGFTHLPLSGVAKEDKTFVYRFDDANTDLLMQPGSQGTIVLRAPVLPNRPYNFLAHLFSRSQDATFNKGWSVSHRSPLKDGAMTLFLMSEISVFTPSVTAAVLTAGVSQTETTRPVAGSTSSVNDSMTILSGIFHHTTAVEFAIRNNFEGGVTPDSTFYPLMMLRMWEATG